tara:strand:- start:187 stop:810 length:624 start_codon:yes stop_codon:yes gene_type:complete
MLNIKKIFKLKLIVILIFVFHLPTKALDPVEIGKPFQKDVEINLSIIENLNADVNKTKIKIKKDIRTKRKKNKDIEIKTKKIEKEKIKNEVFIEEKFARIKEIKGASITQLQILFNSETANLKTEDADKIRNFVNNQTNKKNLNFRITSYAKTNKTADITRRLSLDRAINIRSIIMKEGIPARNLIVKSFGDVKNKENKVIIEFEKK